MWCLSGHSPCLSRWGQGLAAACATAASARAPFLPDALPLASEPCICGLRYGVCLRAVSASGSLLGLWLVWLQLPGGVCGA